MRLRVWRVREEHRVIPAYEKPRVSRGDAFFSLGITRRVGFDDHALSARRVDFAGRKAFFGIPNSRTNKRLDW